jgi:WD40 repeat protein
MEVICLAYSP